MKADFPKCLRGTAWESILASFKEVSIYHIWMKLQTDLIRGLAPTLSTYHRSSQLVNHRLRVYLSQVLSNWHHYLNSFKKIPIIFERGKAPKAQNAALEPSLERNLVTAPPVPFPWGPGASGQNPVGWHVEALCNCPVWLVHTTGQRPWYRCHILCQQQHFTQWLKDAEFLHVLISPSF